MTGSNPFIFVIVFTATNKQQWNSRRKKAPDPSREKKRTLQWGLHSKSTAKALAHQYDAADLASNASLSLLLGSTTVLTHQL